MHSRQGLTYRQVGRQQGLQLAFAAEGLPDGEHRVCAVVRGLGQQRPPLCLKPAAWQRPVVTPCWGHLLARQPCQHAPFQ